MTFAKEAFNAVTDRQNGVSTDEKARMLNPKFPYRIEKAHWYLLLLWREGIITDEEMNRALIRLKEKTGRDFTDSETKEVMTID